MGSVETSKVVGVVLCSTGSAGREISVDSTGVDAKLFPI